MSIIAIKQQKRLKKELQMLENENNISYITACQDKNDMLLFYFLIYGQYDTEYKGGQYIGKIILSKNYPFSPPDFVFLTPNGRFEVNRKICLSITGFHSDEWNPTITISGMLVQLYTVFEKDIDVGLGHIKRTKNERSDLANKSVEFNSTKLSHIYSEFNMTKLNDGKKTNINKDDDINKDNNITPVGILKKVKDIIESVQDEEEFKKQKAISKSNRKYEDLAEPQIIKEIGKLEKVMQSAARNLEFEKAANARDQIKFLKEKIYGANIQDKIK